MKDLQYCCLCNQHKPERELQRMATLNIMDTGTESPVYRCRNLKHCNSEKAREILKRTAIHPV